MYQNNTEHFSVVRHVFASDNEDSTFASDLHIEPPALPRLTYDYILNLPCILLRDRDKLPESKAVYFFFIKNTALTKPIYIGSTRNLRSRICQHDKMLALSFLDDIELDVCIAFLPLNDWGYLDIESLEVSLIRKFKPRMNKTNTNVDQNRSAELNKPISLVRHVSDTEKQRIALQITQPLERMTITMLRQIGQELAVSKTVGVSKKALCRIIKSLLGALYNESKLLTSVVPIDELTHQEHFLDAVSSNAFIEVKTLWQATNNPGSEFSIRELKTIARTLRVFRYSELIKSELVDEIERRILQLNKV